MKLDKFDLKEAKLNKEKIKMEQCETCRGTGIDPATTPVMGVVCPKCKGSGTKVEIEIEKLDIVEEPKPQINIKPEIKLNKNHKNEILLKETKAENTDEL